MCVCTYAHVVPNFTGYLPPLRHRPERGGGSPDGRRDGWVRVKLLLFAAPATPHAGTVLMALAGKEACDEQRLERFRSPVPDSPPLPLPDSHRASARPKPTRRVSPHDGLRLLPPANEGGGDWKSDDTDELAV